MMTFRSMIKKPFSLLWPSATSGNERKDLLLSGMKGFSFYEVLTAFILQLRMTSLTERASGIAFNIVMAIPPTLVFLFTLIPYLPISKQFINQLFGLIRDVIPGE